MSVEPALVVSDNDRRALFVHDGGDGLCDRVDVFVHERIRRVVLGPARHARIVVAKVDDARNPKNRRRVLQFARASDLRLERVVAQLVAGAPDAVKAELTARTRDQHHAMTEQRVVRARPAAEEGFVIGMRVYAEQCGQRTHDERLRGRELNDPHDEQRARRE